jgi:beta-glucosidase
LTAAAGQRQDEFLKALSAVVMQATGLGAPTWTPHVSTMTALAADFPPAPVGGPFPPAVDPTALSRRFGADFTWGTATSAFQIEGAAQEDGRGESIWDRFCLTPGHIADGSNGDVACDHYHRLDADLDLLRDLGVRAYRFSIAWPRVQPRGTGAWNEPGFAFYERVVAGLLARGIAPHVTLYHWDLPQALQDRGGWVARDTVAHFVAYAREVARRLGDRVASITTFNEPWVVATLGHEAGIFAPGLRSRHAAAQVAHHLLLAHGQALQALRADGVRCALGIVLNQAPTHAATSDPADVAQARLEDGLLVRWYMDPLLLGQYPADVLAHLGADAPDVRDGDLDTIRQPLDFLGLNYYTRNVANAGGVVPPARLGVPLTDMGWEIYPAGLRELLVRHRADYPLPPVYIMENGAAFPDRIVDGAVEDADRVNYLHAHITAVAEAITAGVDVRGYFVWSLLDNFEWASGYAKRFGIVHVDYATQRRTPKRSAHWYRALLAAHAAAAGQRA